MFKRWHDSCLGGDLFRAMAQCMDVNLRNYRLFESRSKELPMQSSSSEANPSHLQRQDITYQKRR
ncbi:hypothetical protein E2C01_054322 [Portunus trituberculatus]|uniref:Uncharacterized protein n=1 Tax=Portunus trituberculatus TaxID=210409 RepID=A0A5B7GRP9_PORTR|nr:hypothetical protein [Portunus trituberculatus]